MNKYYITFGQIHTHSINGKTFDKDCVAIIETENYELVIPYIKSEDIAEQIIKDYEEDLMTIFNHKR